jgi:hypothetical protein
MLSVGRTVPTSSRSAPWIRGAGRINGSTWRLFKGKLNASFGFVEPEQIYKAYPDATGKSLRIDIIGRYPMPELDPMPELGPGVFGESLRPWPRNSI